MIRVRFEQKKVRTRKDECGFPGPIPAMSANVVNDARPETNLLEPQ
jgi:hypothetical protein